MMEVLQAFIIAFIFSFAGSIPPGTLNLTVFQFGIEKKTSLVWRFALAAMLIEYIYALIAVKFASLIVSSRGIVDNLHVITGVVMIVLGVINLMSANKPGRFSNRFSNSGFRRGLLLSILNPLAIPFWIAMTAYFKTHDWIDLATPPELYSYLLGVSFGGGTFLISLAYLTKNMSHYFQTNNWVKKIPGILLILLGVYAFLQLLFN